MNHALRSAGLCALGLLAFGCAEGVSLFPTDPPDGGNEDAGLDADVSRYELVGHPCVDEADCPAEGMRCLAGYEVYAEPEVGMIVPRSFCTYEAACETDEDCGPLAGCWRPLEGASAEELAALPFDPAPLEGFSQCLMACERDEDCDQGFVCQRPLLRALGGMDTAPDRPFCVFDDTPPCEDEAVRAPSAGTCTLTYDLLGRFQITATPIGAGDFDGEIGPGTLVVEVSKTAGSPVDGPARVKCFEMDQRFVVSGTVDLETAVRASFVSAGSSTGDLAGGQLTFDECRYAETRGGGPGTWTVEGAASGPGCLAGYESRGVVVCGRDSPCTLGGLSYGSTYQDDTWDQPFNTLTFSNGFEEVEMGGAETLLVGDAEVDACDGNSCPWAAEAVEIPNDNPSRTWLSFSGTLVEERCE